MKRSESNESLLQQFVDTNFKKDFAFREYQKEVILDILNKYDDDKNGVYLLNAPTGSGKSIIAICVAGVLSYKNKFGYILASDLALQDQYENDIDRLGLKWGCVKGVDNYICDVNFEKHSLGDCKVKNLKSKEVQDLPCYETCGYFSNRRRAINSQVSLLNYSYWLIQRNYVAPRTPEYADEPFPIRNFTICDEGHKITKIVQNHFSPRITEKTRPKLEELRTFVKNEFNKEVSVPGHELKRVISKLHKSENKFEIYKLISEFVGMLESFLKIVNPIKEEIASDYEGVQLPKGLIKGMALFDWVKDLHCKFQDYEEIIDNTNEDVIVKNSSKDGIVFNCIDESYLMGKYFHEQTGFTLIMSATLGGKDKFTKEIDAPKDKVTYYEMPSRFDYTKSPIFLYLKRKMTYNEKEKNFPWVFSTIEKIMEFYKGQRGIIHTGSYENSKRIYEALPGKYRSRLLYYSNSEEKKEVLEEINEKKDGVLIGPSLLEGLNLKDDLSRFQIFVKVPYPSLADKYVSTKMKIDRDWYDWETIVGVQQGLGRSIRTEDDYAITYFLDGSLYNLISRNRSGFTDDFYNRLKYVK